MVSLIVGEKGKGKTKEMLSRANASVSEISGNVVYLDKSTKNMYELNNKIRLIDVSSYMVNGLDGFLGFITGILSQDHDLQVMYLDGFMKLSGLEVADLEPAVAKLKKISESFKVDFVVSISTSSDMIPAAVKDDVVLAM